MKRMIALVLSLVMALSLCVPAWAEGETTEELPVAKVTVLGAVGTIKNSEGTVIFEGLEIDTTDSKMGLDVGEIVLDTAYQFQPTMGYEAAQASEYAKWNADFVVKANKDVPAFALALAGYYDLWCSINNDKWVALTNDFDIDANEEIRLVQGMGELAGWEIFVNYEELCNYGNDGIGFLCGAVALNDGMLEEYGVTTKGLEEGTTLTVELRLYETEAPSEENGNTANKETGKYEKICVCNYTFGGAATIGDTTYYAIDEAVAKAENGETITLLADAVEVFVDKAVTINTNGKDYKEVKPAEGWVMVDNNDGTLTFVEAVAEVGDVQYTTLQAAVDAVADKGTITVKANGQSATVSAAKTFTVVYADGVTKATITAGSGYTLSEKDGVYTVSKYVAPYYPPVTETPTEKPAEKPAQTPTQTPTTPAETPVEVVVPVGGNENTVKVEATVTGTTATVDKVDMAQLETVIGSDVDTGKVTIDFSTTAVTTGAVDSNGEIVEAAPVDTVQIPAEVIKQIAEAVADPENNAESLEVVLGDGASIEFDAAALAEKVAQAGGEDITISIKPTTVVADTLSQAQIFTLGEAVAFDITVTSGGVEISDMGGNITISAPYELAEGETAEGIVVYYVDDAGNREKCETVYDAATGRVSWVTNHLSVYMVSYEAPAEDVTPDDGAVDETPVVDDAQSGSPVLWIVIAVVVIAAIVVAVVVSKKRKA